MTDLFDYLNWRGDLTITQSELNPVDALILSCLAYLRLDGIVPENMSENSPTIAAVNAAFSVLPNPDSKVRVENDKKLLERMAQSKRFSQMRLTHYISQFDPTEQKQFSAVTILLGNTEIFLSFRGTDNTLVGWKEDFNMSFLDSVPAQRTAAAYFQKTAESFPGMLWAGGHSKGGNLAVFAAVNCESLHDRIAGVFNNDGPGFGEGFLSTPAHRSISSKIHTFVPQSSVVGMLLEHEENYTVIHSVQKGVFQHDPYSWEVLGPDFIRLDSITSSSKLIDQALKNWVSQMDIAQREHFFDALYEILSATGVQTLSEITIDWVKNARIVLRALKNLSDEDREMIHKTLSMLFTAAKATVPRPTILSPKENKHQPKRELKSQRS